MVNLKKEREMEIKLRKKDVADIVKATYPDYKGRQFELAFQERYYMSDYWSGGSRTYVTALKLENGQLGLSSPDVVAHNPFNQKAHSEFDIPKNVMLVERVFFCGKDLGIRIVVHPDSVFIPRLLPKK